MAFGIDQISNPTPSKINLWVRVFTVSAGIFMAWEQTAPFIGAHTQALISSILGLFIGLANGLAPLFGVEPTAGKVPVSQVTAMDTPSKN